MFAEGRTASAYPVRAWALERDFAVGAEGGSIVQEGVQAAPAFRVAFAVPKRRFKRAVDRNRIKRQLREAWRHGKAGYAAHMAERLTGEYNLDLVLLFTGKERPDYAELTAALDKLMPKLLQALSAAPKTPDAP